MARKLLEPCKLKKASGRGRLFSRLLKWRHPRTGEPLRQVGAFQLVDQLPPSMGPPAPVQRAVQVVAAPDVQPAAEWSAEQELSFDELQVFFGLGYARSLNSASGRFRGPAPVGAP
jgi:hypothetical protein